MNLAHEEMVGRDLPTQVIVGTSHLALKCWEMDWESQETWDILRGGESQGKDPAGAAEGAQEGGAAAGKLQGLLWDTKTGGMGKWDRMGCVKYSML